MRGPLVTTLQGLLHVFNSALEGIANGYIVGFGTVYIVKVWRDRQAARRRPPAAAGNVGMYCRADVRRAGMTGGHCSCSPAAGGGFECLLGRAGAARDASGQAWPRP